MRAVERKFRPQAESVKNWQIDASAVFVCYTDSLLEKATNFLQAAHVWVRVATRELS
jgi:hypothetical protein